MENDGDRRSGDARDDDGQAQEGSKDKAFHPAFRIVLFQFEHLLFFFFDKRCAFFCLRFFLIHMSLLVKRHVGQLYKKILFFPNVKGKEKLYPQNRILGAFLFVIFISSAFLFDYVGMSLSLLEKQPIVDNFYQLSTIHPPKFELSTGCL